MGLGVGLIDAIGGAADGYLAVKGPELQAKLQAEADDKKAKVLAAAEEARDKRKAAQRSEEQRHKDDMALFRLNLQTESAEELSNREIASREKIANQTAATARYGHETRAGATTGAASIRAQQAIEEAKRKREEKGPKGGGLIGAARRFFGLDDGEHPF